jgi:hypothetical protein
MTFAAAIAASAILWATPCPAPDEPGEIPALGCADPPSGRIWVRTADPTLRAAVVAHERGHLYSWRVLDDAERGELGAMMGWPAWREEAFGDQVAACLLTRRQRAKNQLAIGRPRPAVCRALRSPEMLDEIAAP